MLNYYKLDRYMNFMNYMNESHKMLGLSLQIKQNLDLKI